MERFYQIERKLNSSAISKEQYIQLMNEYQSLGYMTKCTKPIDDKLSYYLPHHAVLKSNRLTKKCSRVL